MKYLKLFVVVVFVVSTLVADGITMDDFKDPKPNLEDINRSNEIYAKCLEDCAAANTSHILMVIVKQKMLFPRADYSCLVGPIEKLIQSADNRYLQAFATITYQFLTNQKYTKITADQLYSQDVAGFFEFADSRNTEIFVKNNQ